jgi:hypothetical protein
VRLLACACLLVATPAAAEPTHARHWHFDNHQVGASPTGFTYARTGSGPTGAWKIVRIDDAPSGKQVLAQTDASVTNKGFPVAIADEPSLENAAVSVKCKPISGKIDQVCGLVVRYQDADTYYVSRANALEDNVRVYRVTGGVRKTVGEAKVKVATNTWHDHKLEVVGDRFVVTFDGAVVLDVRDGAIKKAGRIGLWTKADTVMYFDDLVVEPR